MPALSSQLSAASLELLRRDGALWALCAASGGPALSPVVLAATKARLLALCCTPYPCPCYTLLPSPRPRGQVPLEPRHATAAKAALCAHVYCLVFDWCATRHRIHAPQWPP